MAEEGRAGRDNGGEKVKQLAGKERSVCLPLCCRCNIQSVFHVCETDALENNTKEIRRTIL